MPTLLAVVRSWELPFVEFACSSAPPTLTAREKFWPPQSPACSHLGTVNTSSDCRRSPSKRYRHRVGGPVRILLLCTAACLCLGTVACNRADSSLPISGTLWAHLKDERFETVTSVAGLSLGVPDALRQLFGSSSLDIADPGTEFQPARTAAHSSKSPSRRLVAAGCSTDHCLVYYERRGDVPSWRIALFHWGPDATRFEWGGAAPGGLVGIDDVRNAVLSRKVTSPDRSW